jgi:hypothetical protein
MISYVTPPHSHLEGWLTAIYTALASLAAVAVKYTEEE